MARALKEAFEGDGGGADSRPPFAPQGSTEGDSLHHRPGAARLASGQQLRLFPRPDAGSGGGHSCPARQSVFHDDGVFGKLSIVSRK